MDPDSDLKTPVSAKMQGQRSTGKSSVDRSGDQAAATERSRSVALLIETSNAYARGLLKGIASYMHENELWSIYLPELGRDSGPPEWLKRWKGDGIIARIENDAVAAAIQRLDLPVVDVSAARHIPEIPYFEINEVGVGRLAFYHLQERGLRNFAYCDEPRFRWSQLRRDGFAKYVAAGGFECNVFQPKRGAKGQQSALSEREQLTHWIKSLPRPVGVLACYDIKAQEILDVCREQGIRVPEDVALVGVDNDEVLCEICTPPLSSVVPAANRTGYMAAKCLDSLMNGEKRTKLCNLIEPLGVVSRQSTDVLAIDDPDVAIAMRFIRDHYSEGVNVRDVLKVVSISRRSLESRFQNTVGRTLHQEITRRRIARVCQLLNESDLTIAQIAERSGYQNEEYLSVAFRRAMGMPPGRYRRGEPVDID
ncbi:Xylose operon regulatory protein [Rubripirellula lacrimiformis]|uniref:Xylose operon regulatory protein n=2 Tax=Rubripirellula lacrimiformis TaxID=1930273 RepID=A0A517NEE2_9BACT|nr:Xylose operon regulatory protein [Rubripirellula lacrimiformis]